MLDRVKDAAYCMGRYEDAGTVLTGVFNRNLHEIDLDQRASAANANHLHTASDYV